MNESEIRKQVDEAAQKIKDVVKECVSSAQLREIDRIMDNLKYALRNR